MSSIFVYICPMQKHLYLVLFVLVQLWTILIHVSHTSLSPSPHRRGHHAASHITPHLAFSRIRHLSAITPHLSLSLPVLLLCLSPTIT